MPIEPDGDATAGEARLGLGLGDAAVGGDGAGEAAGGPLVGGVGLTGGCATDEPDHYESAGETGRTALAGPAGHANSRRMTGNRASSIARANPIVSQNAGVAALVASGSAPTVG